MAKGFEKSTMVNFEETCRAIRNSNTRVRLIMRGITLQSESEFRQFLKILKKYRPTLHEEVVKNTVLSLRTLKSGAGRRV